MHDELDKFYCITVYESQQELFSIHTVFVYVQQDSIGGERHGMEKQCSVQINSGKYKKYNRSSQIAKHQM